MNFDGKRNDRLRRLYRGPRREVTRRDENGVEWVKLGELDVASGEWTHYHDYRPFRETPLSEWKPRRW